MTFSYLLKNKKHITFILITFLLTIPISIYSTEAVSAANSKANEKATKTKPSKSNKDKETVNSTAIITGTDSGSVTEDIDPDNNNQLEVSGKLEIIDSDAGEASFVSSLTTSSYGLFEFTIDGNWYYSANNNQTAIQNLTNTATLTDILVISSIDGTKHNITVTIYGTDDINTPAVITGMDNGSVTEDVDPDNNGLLEVSGKLNITDSDAGESAFIANITTSSYGRFELTSDGNWKYNADNNQSVIQNLTSTISLTDRLLISSIDGTTHDVMITIYGSDETGNTQSDIIITWVAPIERENNNPISLTEIAGYKIYYGTSLGQYMNDVTINDATAVSHTFIGLAASTYYFAVTTLDTEGRESLYSNEVVIMN